MCQEERVRGIETAVLEQMSVRGVKCRGDKNKKLFR